MCVCELFSQSSIQRGSRNQTKGTPGSLHTFPLQTKHFPCKPNIGTHIKCTTSTWKKSSTFNLIFILLLRSINLHCTLPTQCSLILLILKGAHKLHRSTKCTNQNKMEEWPRLRVSILFQGKPNEKNNTPKWPQF